jgi:hypothetical protein
MDAALDQRTIDQRVKAAMAQETIRARRDAAELAQFRAMQKANREKAPDNKTFSKAISGIAAIYPDSETNQDQQKQLAAAYSALLKDPVLKDAGLPGIAPEEIAIVRFFQEKTTTDDQRRKLMTAANNQLKKLQP